LAAPILVASFFVPERHVGIFPSFINQLKDPSLCCNIVWAIRLDGGQGSTGQVTSLYYSGFTTAHGNSSTSEGYKFGNAMIVPQQQTIQLFIIANAGPATTAFGGFPSAYMIPLRDNLPFDGNYAPLHNTA
jgi:hypothetical protein